MHVETTIIHTAYTTQHTQSNNPTHETNTIHMFDYTTYVFVIMMLSDYLLHVLRFLQYIAIILSVVVKSISLQLLVWTADDEQQLQNATVTLARISH